MTAADLKADSNVFYVVFFVPSVSPKLRLNRLNTVQNKTHKILIGTNMRRKIRLWSNKTTAPWQEVLDRDDAASLAVLRKGQGELQHYATSWLYAERLYKTFTFSSGGIYIYIAAETASFRKEKWTPVWQEQPKGWHRKQYWFIDDISIKASADSSGTHESTGAVCRSSPVILPSQGQRYSDVGQFGRSLSSQTFSGFYSSRRIGWWETGKPRYLVVVTILKKKNINNIHQKPWPPFFRFLHISQKPAMGQAGEDEEMAKWMDYSLQRGVPFFLPIRFFTWGRSRCTGNLCQVWDNNDKSPMTGNGKNTNYNLVIWRKNIIVLPTLMAYMVKWIYIYMTYGIIDWYMV